MKNIKVALGLLAFLSLGLLAPTASACGTDSWCCDTYNDRTIANFSGYGDACAYWGNGCTECYDTGTGDSCVTNGTYCSPKHPVYQPGFTEG